MQFSLASKEPSLITKETSRREKEPGGKKKEIGYAMQCKKDANAEVTRGEK
jgi:hypothetical protein